MKLSLAIPLVVREIVISNVRDSHGTQVRA